MGIDFSFQILAKVFLYGFLGVLALLFVAWLVEQYFRMKRHKETGGVFRETKEVAPKIVNDLWTEIHNEVGISFSVRKMMPKVGTEEDLMEHEGETVETTVFFPPEYTLKENGILLKYPDKTGAKTPKFDYLRGITPEYSNALYKNGLIPYPELYPEATERKDEIFFRFITPADEVELKILNITDKLGLNKMNPMGRLMRPRIWFEEDDLVFDTTNCPLTKDDILKACSELGATFNKNYQAVEKEGDFFFRMPHIRPKPIAFNVDKLNPGRGAILANMDIAKKVLDIIIRKEKETGKRWVFMGETLNPVIKLHPEYVEPLGENGETGVFVPLVDLTHMRIAGLTKQGKSASISSWFYFNIRPYDILIACDGGKHCADFISAVKYHSNHPPIKQLREHASDPMVLFGNAFQWTWNEYQRRKKFFADNGYLDIHDYNAKNPKNPMPWVFFLIDEFKEFRDAVGLGEQEAKGGMGYKLEKLLSGARASGFTLLLASQGAYTETFPTTYNRHLGTEFYHALKGTEASHFLVSLDQPLKVGEFALRINGSGFNCVRTGSDLIRMKLPFIGGPESMEQLFREKMNNVEKDKVDIDYDLLVPKGAVNFEGPNSPVEMFKYLKKLFFKEQGFSVEHLIAETRVDQVQFSAILEDVGNKNHPKEFEGKVLFGLLTKDYEISDMLTKKPGNKGLINNLKPHLILLFLSFDMKGLEKVVSELKTNGSLPKNMVFIPRYLYAKDLSKALGDYEEGMPNYSFRELLRDVWKDFEADETQARVQDEKELQERIAKIPTKGPTNKEGLVLPTTQVEIEKAKARQELFRQKVKEHLARKAKNLSPVEQEATQKIVEIKPTEET